MFDILPTELIEDIYYGLDYKSLINLQISCKEGLKHFLIYSVNDSKFLLNSIMNSEYVITEVRNATIPRGKIKPPFKGVHTHRSNYLIAGPSIKQHYDNKFKMILTKIMYLKSPTLRVERIINFIHQYCNNTPNNCKTFHYRRYLESLINIIS